MAATSQTLSYFKRGEAARFVSAKAQSVLCDHFKRGEAYRGMLLPASSTTTVGATDSGVGSGTNLAAGASVVLFGWRLDKNRASRRLVARVSATGAFDLNVTYQPDATSVLQSTLTASSAVTVDGGKAGYTQTAAVNVPTGYVYRLELFNTSGGNIDYGFEFREFSPH